MRKLYENIHIFDFQKRIVSSETIRGNMVCLFLSFDKRRQVNIARWQKIYMIFIFEFFFRTFYMLVEEIASG